jgi:hypothetical protein
MIAKFRWIGKNLCRHPEVLAALRGEPRRIGHKRPRRSFETPRKMRGSSEFVNLFEFRRFCGS